MCKIFHAQNENKTPTKEMISDFYYFSVLSGFEHISNNEQDHISSRIILKCFSDWTFGNMNGKFNVKVKRKVMLR